IGNSGNMNNGFFIRGDAQGITGVTYEIHIDQIPVDFGMRIPLHLTITGGTFDITTAPFTVPQLPVTLSGAGIAGNFGPINVPTITIGGPQLNLTIGGPGYTIFGGITGTVGPIHMGFGIPAGSGYFNQTGAPSSGFFNSGEGSSSGFFNLGAG
ncbi:hypothetical protein BST27_30935, partial [Mycobacterium intermedium]